MYIKRRKCSSLIQLCLRESSLILKSLSKVPDASEFYPNNYNLRLRDSDDEVIEIENDNEIIELGTDIKTNRTFQMVQLDVSFMIKVDIENHEETLIKMTKTCIDKAKTEGDIISISLSFL